MRMCREYALLSRIHAFWSFYYSDFTQISAQKIGEWSLCSWPSLGHQDNSMKKRWDATDMVLGPEQRQDRFWRLGKWPSNEAAFLLPWSCLHQPKNQAGQTQNHLLCQEIHLSERSRAHNLLARKSECNPIYCQGMITRPSFNKVAPSTTKRS